MATAKTGLPVLILKEGSQRTYGEEARRSNIMAARAIAEMLATSLGPRGMDKMLIDSFGDITITSDGATILKEMEVQHPAAKLLIELAKAVDAEVGDGTTSVVVLAGKLLEHAQTLLDEGIHPTIIIEGFELAKRKALEIIDKIAVSVNPRDEKTLKDVAMTSLSGKVVREYRDFLADLAVKAALKAVEERDGKLYLDIDNIKIEKKKGKSIIETELVEGIVIDKEVVHPGMPKRVTNAKIALLDAPLEIEKPEWSAKIRVEDPEQIKMFLEEEARLLKEMVEKIKSIGANVVITQKGIDEMAQHYLAKYGIMAVRRVKRSDLEKIARATGATIVSSIKDLSPEHLGEAELVEERKVGEEKMIFIEGCKNPKSVTILVRGSNDRIMDEVERSLHDALCVIRDVIREPKIVAGGGAVEIELSLKLREYATTLSGKHQLAVKAFADALEFIPSVLAMTAGMEPVDAIVELKSRHAKGEVWAGVDVINGRITDMMKEKVIEPAIVKKQVIQAAAEAAIMILRIDDVIAAAPTKEEEKKEKKSEEE